MMVFFLICWVLVFILSVWDIVENDGVISWFIVFISATAFIVTLINSGLTW